MKWPYFAVILAVILPGCASIVSKSKYPVYIDTDPKGGTVNIVDKDRIEVFKGIAPAALKLKAGNGFFKKAYYEITVSKQGYQSLLIPVKFKLNGWYFGNLLIGGFIGCLIVDPLTGAMWRIYKDEYFPALEPDDNAKPTVGAVLHVKLLEQVTTAERLAMVKIH